MKKYYLPADSKFVKIKISLSHKTERNQQKTESESYF